MTTAPPCGLKRGSRGEENTACLAMFQYLVYTMRSFPVDDRVELWRAD